MSLDQAMIGQLALEAEIRNMRIGELLAVLITAIVKGGLLEPLLQQHPKRGENDGWPYSLTQKLGKTSMRAGMIGDHHNEYVFEVELLAVVRVRAASESGAREAIRTSRSRSTGRPRRSRLLMKPRLANEAHFIAGKNAIVTEITFFTEKDVAKLVEIRPKANAL